MEVTLDIPELSKGFDGRSFLLSLHTFTAYEKLGLERMTMLMNEDMDFSADEPGRVDC